jgi:hypothetical protein
MWLPELGNQEGCAGTEKRGGRESTRFVEFGSGKGRGKKRFAAVGVRSY